jgi:hypothetical protein
MSQTTGVLTLLYYPLGIATLVGMFFLGSIAVLVGSLGFFGVHRMRKSNQIHEAAVAGLSQKPAARKIPWIIRAAIVIVAVPSMLIVYGTFYSLRSDLSGVVAGEPVSNGLIFAIMLLCIPLGLLLTFNIAVSNIRRVWHGASALIAPRTDPTSEAAAPAFGSRPSAKAWVSTGPVTRIPRTGERLADAIRQGELMRFAPLAVEVIVMSFAPMALAYFGGNATMTGSQGLVTIGKIPSQGLPFGLTPFSGSLAGIAVLFCDGLGVEIRGPDAWATGRA